MDQSIHVAVGVILDQQNRVLIARRNADAEQGDLWEFPGGKLEAGESVKAALQRELREELDIHIDPAACYPFKCIHHTYKEYRVLLDVWRITHFRGVPRGLQGQPLTWCPVAELTAREFPAANAAIIKLLQLPPVMTITGPCTGREVFLDRLKRLLARGGKLIQFRQPDLPLPEYLEWAAAGTAMCRQSGARLILNTDPAALRRVRDADLHVTSARLRALAERPVDSGCLFSASCHSRDELIHAEQIGADLVLLSPVNATTSHPEAVPLGWETFQALAASVSLPVYALGGIRVADLPRATGAGAFGVAGVSDFWPEAC